MTRIAEKRREYVRIHIRRYLACNASHTTATVTIATKHMIDCVDVVAAMHFNTGSAVKFLYSI